ncbi:hypothetical protein ACFX1S_042186 [Malus domestica]
MVVENGTHLLTSFVDRDLFLKSFLSCLDLVGVGNTNHRSLRCPAKSPSPFSLRHRHRLFLHLTHVGTLDDDFFSGLGFLKLCASASRSRLRNTISDDRARGRDGNGESNEGEEKGGDEEMDDRVVDLQFLINGLELGCRDVVALFFLLKV